MKRKVFSVLSFIVVTLLAPCGAARAQDAPKAEVGVQYTSLTIKVPGSFSAETQPGAGARLTFNVTDHLAFEAEGNFFPAETRRTSASGGRAVQFQAGVKAGRRFERWGVFAKARPGVVSYGSVRHFTGTEVITFGGETFTVGIPEYRRRSHFSMDVGAVVEFYHSRRFFTRFDFGDTIIRYGERNELFFLGNEAQIFTIPPEFRHSFQFNAGVGFRF